MEMKVWRWEANMRRGMATLVVLVAAVAASAGDFKAPSCFALVDSHNKVVGTITGFVSELATPDRATETIISTQGRLFPIFAGVDFSSNFSGSSGNFLYFESSDCTGTGYVPGPDIGGGLLPSTAIAGLSLQLWATRPGAVAYEFVAQSALSIGSDECLPTSSGVVGFAADPVFSLASEFVPPFHVAVNRCQ